MNDNKPKLVGLGVYVGKRDNGEVTNVQPVEPQTFSLDDFDTHTTLRWSAVDPEALNAMMSHFVPVRPKYHMRILPRHHFIRARRLRLLGCKPVSRVIKVVGFMGDVYIDDMGGGKYQVTGA
jgi:hypothetical protein